MSFRRRKNEDVCCYNCKEYGHYARDCLLPKRTRKEKKTRGVKDKVKRIFWEVMQEEQRSRGVEDKIKRIFWEVMQEINMKPRENQLLSNVRSLQKRVNNLRVEKKKTS